MIRWVEDDHAWEAFREEWPVDEPPSDFASSVMQAVKTERAVGLGRRGKGLVVPLLLAAIFVSFGAAAAWDQWIRPEAETTELRQVDLEASKQAMRLSFHVQGEAAQAEPEPQTTEDVRPVRLPRSEVERLDEAPAAVAEPTHQPPRVVHYPRCECGTNGVVCTCVD